MGLFGDIIGGIGSIGSKLGEWWLGEQSKRGEEDRRWDKEMAFWRQQNEYNLPSNQMKRLKDAGINPHMAYMKGTINNVAGGLSSAPGGTVNKPNFTDLLMIKSQLLGLKKLQKENKILDANVKKSLAEASYTDYKNTELQKYGMIDKESFPLYVSRQVNRAIKSGKLSSKDAVNALLNLAPLILGGAFGASKFMNFGKVGKEVGKKSIPLLPGAVRNIKKFGYPGLKRR